MRDTRSRRLAASLLFAATWVAPLAAQIPGESVSKNITSMRGEFLAATYEEVQTSLLNWHELIDSQDTTSARRLLADQVRLSPVEGWLAADPGEAVRALGAWLPKVSAYGFTITDFDASSSLAYLMGSVHYQFRDLGGGKVIQADAILVLGRRGARWLIRSYFERTRTP